MGPRTMWHLVTFIPEEMAARETKHHFFHAKFLWEILYDLVDFHLFSIFVLTTRTHMPYLKSFHTICIIAKFGVILLVFVNSGLIYLTHFENDMTVKE